MTLVSQPANQQETRMPRDTIVIVEDDPSNAEVLDLLLRTESSYQVTCFRSGSEILANLDRVTLLKPVLFLLDYRLPTMTALYLYEQLHATRGLEKVPAIVLSGSRMNDMEKDRMLQLGLILIPKPYDIDDLLATIEQVIG